MRIAQGDLMFVKINDPAVPRTAHRISKTPKKLKNGFRVIHEGEKGGHVHVIESGDVMTEVHPRSIGVYDPTGQLKAWMINVQDEATISHRKMSGAKTGEHDSVVLTKGTWGAITQRENDPIEGASRITD